MSVHNESYFMPSGRDGGMAGRSWTLSGGYSDFSTDVTGGWWWQLIWTWWEFFKRLKKDSEWNRVQGRSKVTETERQMQREDVWEQTRQIQRKRLDNRRDDKNEINVVSVPADWEVDREWQSHRDRQKEVGGIGKDGLFLLFHLGKPKSGSLTAFIPKSLLCIIVHYHYSWDST